MEKTIITIQARINAPITTVWKLWTTPGDIIMWNSASDDWHTPRAENDLRAGGKFLSRMEARDGSMGFDFEGVYDSVKINELIEYKLADCRKVKINFSTTGKETMIPESFDAEAVNPVNAQRAGWQSILDNFKRYAEANTLK